MYRKQFSRNNSGRGGFGHRKSGGRNFGGRRPQRQNNNRRRTGMTDHSKFVNKINETQEIQKHVPENSFAGFVIDEQLKTNIARKGFVDPMAIQDKAIPHLLEGKDLIGIANTGMGKTLAFLIPMVDKVIKDRTQKVLIVTPTRELALQIENELYPLTYKTDIRSVSAIGGVSIFKQISNLRKNNNFLIATPGRLKDLYDRKAVDLGSFNNIIVDEVDRMFDMGFAREIQFLLDQTSKERQSLFFSATINDKIGELIRKYSNDPITVSVKTRDTAASVDQDIVKVQDMSKRIEVLHDLLIQDGFEKVLIFGRTKHGVERLARDLRTRGFKAESIHGNKTQGQRQRALKSFKEGAVNILVATDVAARGLDIPNVTHVINYDIPETYEDYIHRIGRTGRANALGKALTFVG